MLMNPRNKSRHAQHEAMEATMIPIVRNEIEVRDAIETTKSNAETGERQ